MENRAEQITVLLVDDDPETLAATERVLKPEGYTVVSAASAAECRELIDKCSPDLVLLDVVLADGDGRDLCREIKSDPARTHLHVILISGLKISSDEQANAIEMGADAYIIRPIGNRELRARIRASSRLIVNEKELSTATKIAEGLIDSMQDGFLELDIEGRQLKVNKSFLDMTGFEEQELIGAGVPHPYWSLEEYERIEKAFQKTLRGDPTTVELVLKRKNAERFPALVCPSCLKDDQGNVIRYFATVKNLTDIKRTELLLQRRIEYAQLLTEISAELAGLRSTHLNPAIDNALSLLAASTGADRAYVFQFRDGAASLVNTHEWCAPDIESQKENLQNILVKDELPWFMEHIGSNGILEVADVSSLPPEAHLEKAHFLAQDIQSLIVVPIGTTENLKGFLGFDAVHKPQKWREDDKSLLQFFSQILSHVIERQEVEQTLQQSENRFRRLADNAQDMVYRMSLPDGFYEYVSPASVSVLGVTPEEMYRSPVHLRKILHRDWQHYFEQQWENLLQGHVSDIYEYQIVRRDGSISWINQRNVAVRDDRGRLVAIEGIATDITQQKKIEEALRISEERFKLAMEFANDGLYDWNLETNEIYFSPVWKSLVGYADDELPNDFSVFEQLTKPEDVTASWKMLNEVLEKKRERFELELQMRHKDGHWVDILSRANVIFNNEDKGARVIGTHVDISQRKYAEKELIRHREKAERYLNLAGVMFIGLDKHGTVNLANKKACTILECTQKEIIGQNWFDQFIPARLREEVRSVFEDLMAEKIEQVEYHENPVLTKSGTERHIAWHNTFITDDERRPVGILGSGEDFTEKKKLQNQLFQAQKMESIGTLAGGIAHDFNNILSSIIGFTELALDEAMPDSVMADNLQEVHGAGLRAKELVKQILAFARQSGEETKPVRPRTIAKEIIHLLRSSIPSTIKISHHIASEAFIKANPTQIHQIIMNLCTNAAQAMEPKGGQLSISIEDVAADQIPAEKQPALQAKAFVRLRIADTGDGIPPEIFHLIFEPYFTTKGPGEGTGMGLAMVQGIVESSGGLIEVDSTYGEGSTFTIYLPIISHQKTQHAYEAEALSGGKERVLLVDDEAPIAKMGSLMLERLGYDVTTHISSTDALEVFKARPEDFDVVITDMTMPNLTGDKLALAVLNIRPDIPVILSTGYSKHISEETARDIGIKAFIYKPFVKADLASAVRTVLDGGMNL